MKFIKDIILVAAVLAASSGAMAKQFVLNNTSPNHQPINVEMQVVRQQPGQPVVRGETQSFHLVSSQPVTLDNAGFKLVGIRLLAVNGHKIPDGNEVFTHLSEADANNPTIMDISLQELPDGHGNISVNVH